MINILWASMFGAAEDVAYDLDDKAKSKGFETNVKELNDVTLEDLQSMKNVAIVTSTTGHGDMPTNGDDFLDMINETETKLENIEYSVCALGDSSHTDFCGAGRKVDERMTELGAKAILERQQCDGDDSGSEEWGDKFLERITV